MRPYDRNPRGKTSENHLSAFVEAALSSLMVAPFLPALTLSP